MTTVSVPDSPLSPISDRGGMAAWIQEVGALMDASPWDALPRLAQIDRKAPGWLTVSVGPGTVIALSWMLLGILYLFSASVWLVSGHLLLFFVNSLWPGWGPLWLVGLLTGTAGLLFRSPRVRSAVLSTPDSLVERTQRVLPPIARWLPLRLCQILAVGVIGWFLFMTLFPVLLAAWEIVAQLVACVGQGRQTAMIMRASIAPSLVLFVVLSAIAVLLLRKTPRAKLILANLMLLAVLGVGDVYRLSMNAGSDQSLLVAGMVGALALVYPTGFVYKTTYWSFRPLAWFYEGVSSLLLWGRLRYLLAKAIYRQRLRHNENVGWDGSAAVCHLHLRYFHPALFSLSYGRRLVFWSCPECKQDNPCYQHINKIRACLDPSLDEPSRRQKTVLEVRLPPDMHGDLPPGPLFFDEVVIRNIEQPSEIRTFIDAYKEVSVKKNLPPLDRLACFVQREVPMDTSLERLVASTFARVSSYE